MHALGMSEWVLVLVYGFLIILPFWKILSKAGYHPAWSVVAIIPLVNVIVLYVFAFARWPNLDRSGK